MMCISSNLWEKMMHTDALYCIRHVQFPSLTMICEKQSTDLECVCVRAHVSVCKREIKLQFCNSLKELST